MEVIITIDVDKGVKNLHLVARLPQMPLRSLHYTHHLLNSESKQE